MKFPIIQEYEHIRKCPACGAALGSGVNTTDLTSAPKAGAISICFECTAVNRYISPTELITLSEQEFKGLMLEEPTTFFSILELIADIKRFRASQ